MKTLTVDLDDAHAAVLEKLANEMQAGAGEVLGVALDLLEDARAPGPPLTPGQIAAIEAGLRDLADGRVIDHDQVFVELDAKYGA